MKKFLVFLTLLAGIVVFSQCNNDAKTEEAECAPDPNPNKSSELAILMRKMAAHADSTKGEVLAGKLTGSFPEEFRKILTAVPSDSMIKGEHFDAFASGYLKSLESLYSGQQDLDVHYKALVNSCVNCHENTCPGPLVRINKLKI